MISRVRFCVLGLLFIALISACKHEPSGVVPKDAVKSNFPGDVAVIFETKCAVSGCHNAASYTAAGGLLLDSWEHLFDGGNNGAVVVPYSSIFSSLLYFVNTNEDSGLVQAPTMPINADPLTPEEYSTLKQWIDAGAPDADGNIPFADRATSRQKIYAIQGACDVLTVIDAEKNVVMRYLYMGKVASQETITDIAMSPDGNYLYLFYYLNNIIQKLDTRTDKVVAEGDLQDFFWRDIYVSDDGAKIVLSSSDDNSIRVLDANNLQQLQKYKFNMSSLKSVVSNKNTDTIYVASSIGNTIYEIANNQVTEISIDSNPPSTNSSTTAPNPWDMEMSPDYSKIFITCSQTNDVRIVDTRTNELIKTIPVGETPQQITRSKSKPYIFVSCMNDPSTELKAKGSIYVINYETLEVVKKIQSGFYEPYGIAIDDEKGTLYFVSRNFTADGPQPHHGSLCGDRNGYYQIFDLNTLEPVNNKRYEILANPTETVIRF